MLVYVASLLALVDARWSVIDAKLLCSALCLVLALLDNALVG